MTILHPDEDAIIEHLAQCYCLANDVDGLDLRRFQDGVKALEDMIFAVPTKRRYLGLDAGRVSPDGGARRGEGRQ